MKFNQILERLYQKYYLDENLSDVTSSHWKHYGRKISVIKSQESYELKGLGFGNHQRKNVFNIIRTIPQRLLLHRMLRENNANPKTVTTVNDILNSWDLIFGFSHLKNLLSFDLLHSHGLFNQPGYICIIGDGYGFLGTLIRMMFPKSKIIFVNLGKVLLFDAYYFSLIFKDLPVVLVEDDTNEKTRNYEIIFMEAENYEFLNGLPISLFINIASMQEMNLEVIQHYFQYMRSSLEIPYFYCCNRLEKKLPDGTMVRFLDYPWDMDDKILIDELSPWYQTYPAPNPPFWRRFDGPIHHRLVKLKRRPFE